MRFEVVEKSDSFSSVSGSTTETAETSELSTDDVIVGNDGWLFLGKAAESLHGENDSVDSYITTWCHELASREAHFSNRGIRYLHVCVPDKMTIHGDSLSKEGSVYSLNEQFSPLKKLSAYKSQLACLIDSSGYLLRSKGQYPLYWKSDTRWTPWSAYMTCQLLCSSLKAEINNQMLGYPFDEAHHEMNLDEEGLPDEPETIRTYRLWLRSKRRFSNDVVKLRESMVNSHEPLLSHSEYGEGAHVVFENHHDKANKLCLIVFGDEHSADNRTLLTGMLAETFSEVHFVWGAGIDYDYVNRVQPDVVITQGSELQLLDRPSSSIDMHDLATRSIQNLERLISSGAVASDKKECGDIGRSTDLEPVLVTKKSILPPERYALDSPIMVQQHPSFAHPETEMTSNEVVLHEISEAQVFFNGSAFWVHDKSGQEILRDNVPQTQRRALPWCRGKQLLGNSLLFATSPGAHCYYHWMLEILPKLGMLEREGISLDSIDHFLVREITGEWQLETLARFGIDRSRIVETVKQPYWRCERLLHIDLNCGINLKMPRFIPQWMKHLYPTSTDDTSRIKLYITRPSGVRRGIANEQEFLPLLEAAGFTIMAMEGLSVVEQAALLARADVLMSPHGGALTNMVFCRPGIKVVEMFSRHVFPYYYGLAANCEHQYHAILQNPAEDYPRLVSSSVAQSFADSQHETAGLSFDVSVDAIKAVLKLIE